MSTEELAAELRKVYMHTPGNRGMDAPRWVAVADAAIAGFHRTPAPAPDAQALTADARREAGKWGPGPTATGLLLHRLADALEAAAVSAPQDTEWEYQCRLADNPWTEVADRTHGVNCSGTMRRRRKAGPWEPVPTEGVSE